MFSHNTIKKIYTYYSKEKQMDIFSVITLLGGLTFFLFGMDVMSKNLEKYFDRVNPWVYCQYMENSVR